MGSVFVSGNRGNTAAVSDAILDSDTKPVITRYEGASIICSGDQAIALNGLAEVNVYGGTIEGREAVGFKRGILNVAGGTFHANGNKYDPADANNSGTEATGAALSITSTYNNAGLIKANISGGTFTSANNAALYVGHSKNGSTYNLFAKGVTLNIANGGFIGGSGQDAVFVADKITGDTDMPSKFIFGGKYSSNPTASYVADVCVVTDAEAPYVKKVTMNSISGETSKSGETPVETPITVDVDATNKTAELQPIVVNDIAKSENIGKTTEIVQSDLETFAESNEVEKVEIITGLSATPSAGSEDVAPQTKIVNDEGATIFEAKAFGGQFRYDKKMDGTTPHGNYPDVEKPEAIDYLDLRLAYQFTLPEGVDIKDVTWGWNLVYGDGQNDHLYKKGTNYLERSYDSEKRADGTKTYTSNLVVTNLKIDSKKLSNFKATMTITYPYNGKVYTITQSDVTPLARTITNMVNYYRLNGYKGLDAIGKAYVDEVYGQLH
jgi:hypothetical protein